jgi:hypothetical protein
MEVQVRDADRQRTTDTGFTVTHYLAVIRVIVASAIFPTCAIADANVWYTTPAEQGDCGEECYTPATAWIDTEDGNYAFSISCGNVMIMAGPAMMRPQPPFSMAEILIDSRSFGDFSVYNGLNDTFVSAANIAAQSTSDIQDAINYGSTLRFRIANRAPLDFTLSRSRAAIKEISADLRLNFARL